jgi:uncharacterized delta-60 repeat protein
MNQQNCPVPSKVARRRNRTDGWFKMRRSLLLGQRTAAGLCLGAWLSVGLLVGWAQSNTTTGTKAGEFSFAAEEYDITYYEGAAAPDGFRCLNGVLVTVNRLNGSTGRVMVDWKATDITWSEDPAMMLLNPYPLFPPPSWVTPPIDGTLFSNGPPLAGTLIFDDGQTSTNFYLNWSGPFLGAQPLPSFLYSGTKYPYTNGEPAVLLLELSNPRAYVATNADGTVDPLHSENPDVIRPILSPYTADPVSGVVTPTNSVLVVFDIWDGYYITGNAGLRAFALDSLQYRVDEYGNRNITVAVDLPGGGGAGVQVNLVINNLYAAGGMSSYGISDGSDYAGEGGGGDFTAQTVTLTFPNANTLRRTAIITILDDSLVEFNEDIGIDLRNPVGQVNNQRVGINPYAFSGVVTILYNNTPPGAVDREWNPPDVPYTVPVPYNSAPGANDQVFTVAVQPDGKTVLGGVFTAVNGWVDARNGVGRCHLARLNTDGSLDTNFMDYPNLGADGFVSKVLVQTNLTGMTGLFIAGGFTTYDGNPRNSIARLLSDGSLDSTFNPGSGANGPIWDLALQADGRIVIAGGFTLFNGVECVRLARLNPDGSLDTSFAPSVPDDTVLALALDEAGPGEQGIFLGGQFSHCGQTVRNHLARLVPSGALDTTFDPGLGADGAVYTLARQGDGRLLLAGSFSEYNGVRRGCIARANHDGSLDTAFDPGAGADDAIYAMASRPDGRVYLGGLFSSYNGTRRIGLALLQTNGLLDTSFMDTAYNQFAGVIRQSSFEPKNFVNCLALQADGNLMVGGSFTNLGGNKPLALNESASEVGVWTRQDKTVRCNIARLIGTWGRTGSAANPEQGPGLVGFQSPIYSTSENQGTATLWLARTGGLLGAVEALAATSNRTATAGLDYLRTNETVVFAQHYTFMDSDGAPGPAGCRISILDDALVEGSEVLDLELSASAGRIILGGEVIPLGAGLSLAHASLAIADNDVAHGTLAFSAAVYSTNEGAGQIILTVLRTNGSSGMVSVDYFTVDGTAGAPGDYVWTSNRLTFYSGETNKGITVSIVNDRVVGPDKSFFVTLTNATGGAVLPGGLPTSSVWAEVHILDDDRPPAINVLVRDESSHPVPGVGVWVSSDAGGTNYLASDWTGSNGLHRFTVFDGSWRAGVNCNDLRSRGFACVSDVQTNVAGSDLIIVFVVHCAGPLRVTTTALPMGFSQATYRTELEAAGGLWPYTWAVVSNALPGGLVLDTNSGVVSGVSAAMGTFNFTVRVTDSANATAEEDLVLLIRAARQWYDRAFMAEGRASAGAAVVGSRIYLVGGAQAGWAGALDTLAVYDTELGKWTSGASMPSACVSPVAGAINGLLYVAGESTLTVYDPQTDRWTNRQSMSLSRSYACGGVISNQLYLAGGTSSTSGTLEVYDPVTDRWSTLAPMPTPRTMAAAVVVSNRLWVLGGFDSIAGGADLDTVEIYDPQTDAWSTGPSLPKAGRFAAAVAEGTICVLGGGPSFMASSQLLLFDLAAGSWSNGPPIPTPRDDLAAVTVGDSLFALGGWCYQRGMPKYMPKVEQFSRPGADRVRAVVFKSDATTLASALSLGTPSPAVVNRLDAGESSGLTFQPALVDGADPKVDLLTGAAATPDIIKIPPGDGRNGFFKSTFVLPESYRSAQLSLMVNADRYGRAFLNGQPVTGSLYSNDTQRITSELRTFYTLDNPGCLRPGTNEFIVADVSDDGTGSSATFYGFVTFRPCPLLKQPVCPVAGGFEVRITAPLDGSYTIQFKPALESPWTSVLTTNAAEGTFLFRDTAVTNRSGFYRVIGP